MFQASSIDHKRQVIVSLTRYCRHRFLIIPAPIPAPIRTPTLTPILTPVPSIHHLFHLGFINKPCHLSFTRPPSFPTGCISRTSQSSRHGSRPFFCNSIFSTSTCPKHRPRSWTRPASTPNRSPTCRRQPYRTRSNE